MKFRITLVLLAIGLIVWSGCTSTQQTTTTAKKKAKSEVKKTADKAKDKATDTAKKAGEEIEDTKNLDTSEADALLMEDKDKWGPDSLETVKNYSLYREFFKQDAYAESLPHWRYVYQNAPAARKTPLMNGEAMYKALLDAEKDGAVCSKGEVTEVRSVSKARKACKKEKQGKFKEWKWKDAAKAQAYKDTIDMIYTTRQKYFGEQAVITTKRTRMLMNYSPEKKEDITKLRNQAIEEQAEEAPFDFLYVYFLKGYNGFARKEIDTDSLTSFYDNIAEIMTYNIENNSKDSAKYVKYYDKMTEKMDAIQDQIATKQKEQAEARKAEYEKQLAEYEAQIEEYKKWQAERAKDSTLSANAQAEYAEKLRKYEEEKKRMVSNIGQAERIVQSGGSTRATSCASAKELYAADFQSNPTASNTKKLYAALKQNGCNSDPLYNQALTKLVELEPTPARMRFVAQQATKQKNYSKALQYYEKAISMETDPSKNAKVYLRMAKIAQVDGKYSKARQLAKKALSAQAGWGEPYMLIGDLYASSTKRIKDGMGGRSALWAAVDMYAKARDIDPYVDAKASSKISRYAGSFPDKQTGFMSKGLKAGQSYTVGGWIGQRTRVRFSD